MQIQERAVARAAHLTGQVRRLPCFMSAGEVAEHFELSKPTLSGHFTVLKHAGLIRGDKRGTSIVYQLNVTLVEEALWHLMNTLNMSPQRKVRASPARGSRRSRSSS